MAKGKAKMSPKVKKWLIGIGIGALVLILGGMAIKLNKLDKTDEVSTTFGYEQGLLSADDGGEVQGTTSIRTKDFVSLKDFKCDIDEEEGAVTYRIFWYDEDEAFISATQELTSDFDSKADEVPETAKYARIMITPTNDPEVSPTEISKYASELSVEFIKK